MPVVQLDCAPNARLVTAQLTRPELNQILSCYPCVLRVPERPNPQAEDVLLPSCTKLVTNMAELFEFGGLLLSLDLHKQLDSHVKAAVQQHQLANCESMEHMAGIEDVSVVVDMASAVGSELPSAVQEIYADRLLERRRVPGSDSDADMPELGCDDCDSDGESASDEDFDVPECVLPVGGIAAAIGQMLPDAVPPNALGRGNRHRRRQKPSQHSDCFDSDLDGLIEVVESETDTNCDSASDVDCEDAIECGDGWPGTSAVMGESEVVDRIRRVFTGEDVAGKVGVVVGKTAAFPDMDKRWPAFTHPSVFPYGVGTPPEGMTYDAWLPVILQRAPSSQYAEQPMLVLDMFNVTQRHLVNRVTKQQLCSDPHMFKEFARMSTDDLVLAADLFDSKLRGTAYCMALAAAPPCVQKFLRALRKINSKVRATPAYYASCRSQAFAPWHAVGPFTVFPTFNPSELHSSSAMRLLGFHIEYAANGEPITMPSMVSRWRAVAANPIACAQFFDCYRAGIWDVFYGWPRGTTGLQQLRPDCRFGKLRAIVDRAECSTRGGLHPHMLGAQAAMQPWHLRRLQVTALPELVKFAGSIASKQLPGGWWLADSGDWVDMSDPTKAAVDFKHVTESGQLGVCYKLPVERLHELLQASGSDTVVAAAEAAANEVEQFQARTAASNQSHNHSHRCQKGNHRGDDDDCAMHKPEEARSGPVKLEGGCMLLQCDHGMLVPYCPALMLVDPCNQAIILCWDASRWRTQQLRAENATVEFDLDVPTLELHAAQAANYALKYITKPGAETQKLAAVLVASLSSCKPVDLTGLSDVESLAVSKSRAVQFLNRFNSKQVVAQSLCSLYLMGKGDFYITHQTVAYYPSSFISAMRDRVAPHLAIHMRQSKEMATAVNTGGRIDFVSQSLDYRHRNEALKPVPAYFYLMCAEKVTGRTADSAPFQPPDGEEWPEVAAAVTPIKGRPRFDFKGSHPQSMSHTVHLRSELHLPQPISNYPADPGEDAEQLDKDTYALSILSMLTPDHMLDRLCHLGFSLWEIFVAWRAEAEIVNADGLEQPQIGRPAYDFGLFMVDTYPGLDGEVIDGIDWLSNRSVPLPSLSQALGLLHEALLPDCVLSDAYAKWHGLGQFVARNIQSLAAAQAEDRRRATLVKRSQLARAGKVHASILSDDSDSGFDSEDRTQWDEDKWAVSSALESPGDEHELLFDLLTPANANSKAAGYAMSAVSRLPPVGFGSVANQHSHQPPVGAGKYLTPTAVKDAITCGDLLQTTAATAQAAAAAATGLTPYLLKHVGSVGVSNALLLQSGTANVHARINYIGTDGTSMVTDLQPAVHGPPPDKKLSVRPSVVDTVRLFTLSTEQAFAFVQLAEALVTEKETKLAHPIRMILTGQPGTGKSQVLKAFEWFALQYDASDLLLVAAFTWRAALQVATSKHPALSTCKAFAINPVKNTVGDSSDILSGKRFVFIDEYSFINCLHLSQISASIRDAFDFTLVDGSGSFGDMNVILCGDLCQHKPVGGSPLFTNNSERTAYTQLLRAEGAIEGHLGQVDMTRQPGTFTGLQAYHKFDRVVFLLQQQRIENADDMLFPRSRLFMSEERPSKAVVAAFCDELNAKVVSPVLLEQWARDGEVPRAVCLRNEIRMSLNQTLLSLHGRHLNARPIVWFSCDTVARGKRLATDPTAGRAVSQVLKNALKCMKPEDTNDVPGIQIFFPGCMYSFNDNVAPGMGYVNNSQCEGVDLLLAEGEVDDLQHSCWILKRPPLAVFVKPLTAEVSRDSWISMKQLFPALPAGCIPVCPAWTAAFKVKAYLAEPGGHSTTFKVRRFGINLSDAYAVTDFYVQGMSFGEEKWMAHLAIPPDTASMKRAALFVVLTRFAAWCRVWLVSPLWPAGDASARAAVIKVFHKLACLEPELKAELQRLRVLANECKVRYNSQWTVAEEAAVHR